MRKAFGAILVVGLLVGALVAPAGAKGKPVKKTFYLHGVESLGEAEIPQTWLDAIWHVMDATKPAEGQPKSQFVTNYGVGPNTNCSGNGLLPVWKGEVSGTIVGTITLTLHTLASPGAQLNASLFQDATGGCNEAAQPPAAEATVDVPAGQGVTKIVFKKVRIPVVASLVLQLEPPLPVPTQVRVFYDAASADSNIKFAVKKGR
jgi:hypothetical protein